MKTELEVCQDLMEIISQCEVRIIKAKKAMSELTGIEMEEGSERNGLVTEDMWEKFREIFNENMSRIDNSMQELAQEVSTNKADVDEKMELARKAIETQSSCIQLLNEDTIGLKFRMNAIKPTVATNSELVAQHEIKIHSLIQPVPDYIPWSEKKQPTLHPTDGRIEHNTCA